MKQILLHSCCAPCSAAILEWLLQNDYKPTILFFNPNIFPREEYEKRKSELVRHAESLGVDFFDGDLKAAEGNDTSESWNSYHEAWKSKVCHLAEEPERGERCLNCFKIRLEATAAFAQQHGFELFTTSLLSSRWKDINQIFEAGRYAASLYPKTTYWEKNWRKGGLYERRNLLAKQFYNQQYCGCEYSMNSISPSYNRTCSQ